jgi:hypothetical protein
MTELVGAVAGWLCFVGGLICWYLDQYSLACTLLAASYLLGEYSSSIIIRNASAGRNTEAV